MVKKTFNGKVYRRFKYTESKLEIQKTRKKLNAKGFSVRIYNPIKDEPTGSRKLRVIYIRYKGKK